VRHILGRHRAVRDGVGCSHRPSRHQRKSDGACHFLRRRYAALLHRRFRRSPVWDLTRTRRRAPEVQGFGISPDVFKGAYGWHELHDAALQTIAKTMRSLKRPVDILRHGARKRKARQTLGVFIPNFTSTRRRNSASKRRGAPHANHNGPARARRIDTTAAPTISTMVKLQVSNT